jgi:hypothetical protein
MKKGLLMGLAVAFVVGLAITADQASAIPDFNNAWKERYTKDNPALKEKSDAAKCNVCHVGTDKKMRNAYGKALDALLDRKTDGKDAAKINAAFDEVEALKVNPDDENSETFGDRLKAGELPVAPE